MYIYRKDTELLFQWSILPLLNFGFPFLTHCNYQDRIYYPVSVTKCIYYPPAISLYSSVSKVLHLSLIKNSYLTHIFLECNNFILINGLQSSTLIMFQKEIGFVTWDIPKGNIGLLIVNRWNIFCLLDCGSVFQINEVERQQ